MNCHCSSPKEANWDTEGAAFFCEDCNQPHRMCCIVNEAFICGEVENHPGDHRSITAKVSWPNMKG